MGYASFFPERGNVPELFVYHLRLLGVNDAAPTVELGSAGVTVTRTGEGAYRVAFAENPGVFCGFACGLGAATPADLAGYTVVRDTFDTTNNYFEFIVYNTSDAAADIIANQYLDLHIMFKRTGLSA